MKRQRAHRLETSAADEDQRGLAALRNVGRAVLADFARLGVRSVAELARQDADELYLRLCRITASRQDPCVHDTFAAAIHQARTGEARDWWSFTPERKKRRARGEFPGTG